MIVLLQMRLTDQHILPVTVCTSSTASGMRHAGLMRVLMGSIVSTARRQLIRRLSVRRRILRLRLVGVSGVLAPGSGWKQRGMMVARMRVVRLRSGHSVRCRRRLMMVRRVPTVRVLVRMRMVRMVASIGMLRVQRIDRSQR